MHFKFDQNLVLLWVFLSLQALVLVSYFLFAPSWSNHSTEAKAAEPLPKPIQFVGGKDKALLTKLGLDKFKTYYNADVDEEIYLRSEHIEDYFIVINDTLCFRDGTDIGYMRRNKEQGAGKCECLPGYHSNDCSLPEVMWRAFIASHHAVISKRSGHARRVIQALVIGHPAHIQHAAVLINDLAAVVDLFVVAESNATEYGEPKPFYFKQKLDKGLLKQLQYKILYAPVHVHRNHLRNTYRTVADLAWEKSSRVVKNLRDDDLFVNFDNNQIPSPKALLFFKLFDGFSLPVAFRLKWNVYGYFYQHPNRTRTVTTGASVQTLSDVYKNNPALIARAQPGLVVGDLNHYGGWFCELCHDPNDVLNVIQSFGDFEEPLSHNGNVIDVKYLEQLVGDGRYIDGKAQLLHTHADHDPYYAPGYIVNNSWKFDALLINFYNKIDYN